MTDYNITFDKPQTFTSEIFDYVITALRTEYLADGSKVIRVEYANEDPSDHWKHPENVGRLEALAEQYLAAQTFKEDVSQHYLNESLF